MRFIRWEREIQTVGAQASKQNGAVVLWNRRAGSKLQFAGGIISGWKLQFRNILPALIWTPRECDVIRCLSAFNSATNTSHRSPFGFVARMNFFDAVRQRVFLYFAVNTDWADSLEGHIFSSIWEKLQCILSSKMVILMKLGLQASICHKM